MSHRILDSNLLNELEVSSNDWAGFAFWPCQYLVFYLGFQLRPLSCQQALIGADPKLVDHVSRRRYSSQATISRPKLNTGGQSLAQLFSFA